MKKSFCVFSFIVILFLGISFITPKSAMAFDVETSPTPLPSFSDDLYNRNYDLDIPLYSSDGYQVGTYKAVFYRYLRDISSDYYNIEASVGFSFPSDFIINGVSIDRELIEIIDVTNSQIGSPGLFSLWVPKMGYINSSNFNTVDYGCTTISNNSVCYIRPAGYYGSGNKNDYYFMYRLSIRGDINSLNSGFDQFSPSIGSPLYNILSSLSYKNGIFLDYSYMPDYNLRVHNSYACPIIGFNLYSIFQSYFTSSETFVLPELKFVLPYDYLTLANNDFLAVLKFNVQQLKEIKADLSQLINNYDDLSKIVDNINSLLSSMSVDLSEINNQYNSLLSKVTSIESDLSELKSTIQNVDTKLSVLSDMSSTLLRIETAINFLKSSIKDYSGDFEAIKDLLADVNTGISNLDKMFTDFTSVSSELLNEFMDTMSRLDEADKKFDELAESLKVPAPDLSNLNTDINSLVGGDFAMSTSWITSIFEIPYVLTIIIFVFTLALISYVLYGRKS